MRGELDKTIATFAVIMACAAGTAVAAASGILSSASHALIYVLANLILIFDMIDLIVRIWLKQAHGVTARGPSFDLSLPDISNAERTMSLSPYAIIASLHNAADSVDRFIATLAPFKDVVWLIDDASSDGTLLRLRRDGWNCVSGSINRNKPGALSYLLKTLPPEIQTVVVMDPDVHWKPPSGSPRAMLERVISDLQRSGAAALTPRILARRGGWLVELQAFEYEIACGLGRKSLRDVTCNSGVSVYSRASLEAALAQHSLSIYAEDFENSILLLAAGQRIYYDDRLVVETEASRSWKRLFSQRVGWAFGCAKLFVERLPLIWRIARRSPLGAYQYTFYLGINGILLLPLKLVSIFILSMSFVKCVDELLLTHLIPSFSWNDPLLFALWYGKAVVVLFVACLAALQRGDRVRHFTTLPFYPLYSLAHYIPMTVGYLNVVTVKLFGKRIYRDHYDAAPRVGIVARRPAPPSATAAGTVGG